MTTAEKRTVLLLSGGLDSATVLAAARRDGWTVHALSVRYGQRHAVELDAASRIARTLGAAEHRIIELDLAPLASSALTRDDVRVPTDRDDAAMSASIPATYVPARNTVFLSLALAWAESLGAFDIHLGVNAVDYSGYPDCRPEFLHAFEALASVATKAGVESARTFTIHAPLLRLTKAEIIALGTSLGVDYGMTTSCYDPGGDGAACGHCDACTLRLRGFAEAGLRDPAHYEDRHAMRAGRPRVIPPP